MVNNSLGIYIVDHWADSTPYCDVFTPIIAKSVEEATETFYKSLKPDYKTGDRAPLNINSVTKIEISGFKITLEEIAQEGK